MKVLFSVMIILLNTICFLSAQSYPDWVLTPPVNDNEIFSIGIASSKNKQMGINSASNLARAELSRVISVRVMNQLVNMTEESKGVSSSVSKTVSNQLSESIMKGATISQVYEDTSSKIPTYYVLVSISINDLKASFSVLTDERAKELLSGSADAINSIDKQGIVAKDSSVQSSPVTAKTVMKEAEPKTGKKLPVWVSKFPTSTEYYVGIGQGNSIKTAQDGAMTMIISQIRAKVQAEMKTFMQEVNGATEESFSQVIKMSLMETVEDIEYIDAFYSETDSVYYSYYRLNIAEYKRKQAEKERLAKEKAFDLLKRTDTEKDASLALKHLLIAYITIAPFISKDIRVQYQDNEVILANELMTRIQKMMQNIQIDTEKTQFESGLINFSPLDIKFNVSYSGEPMKYLPFTFSNTNGNLDMIARNVTDGKGVVRTIINSPGKGTGLKTVKIMPDILSFMKDTIDEETAFLYLTMISGLGMPSQEVTLDVKAPVFSLSVSLSGSIAEHKERADIAFSEFKNAFEKSSGAKFTDKGADFTIKVMVLSTTTLSDLSKQYFTRMTVSVSIIDTKKNEEIYSKSTQEFKGGNISEVKAMQAAIEKYISSYNADFVNEIVGFFSLGKN